MIETITPAQPTDRIRVAIWATRFASFSIRSGMDSLLLRCFVDHDDGFVGRARLGPPVHGQAQAACPPPDERASSNACSVSLESELLSTCPPNGAIAAIVLSGVTLRYMT